MAARPPDGPVPVGRLDGVKLKPSPNSGWPMAAMALRLGIRLGKPGVYVLNEGGRGAAAADTARAARLAARGVAWAGACATAAIGCIALRGVA